MALSCTCFTMNLYIYMFSTNFYAFSLRISCMYMASYIIIIIIIIIIIKTAFYVPRVCCLLQVYGWQSLHFTSFHLYLCPAPSVRAQSSSPTLFGWFFAQALKFPAPVPAQVNVPSLEMSFNPNQDFAPFSRRCINTFSSLLLTLTRLVFSCRQLARASVQFAHFVLIA